MKIQSINGMTQTRSACARIRRCIFKSSATPTAQSIIGHDKVLCGYRNFCILDYFHGKKETEDKFDLIDVFIGFVAEGIL